MPEKASSEYRGEAAAAAFERVLEAERAAEAAVAGCRKEAADLLAAAAGERCALQADVDARVAAWRFRLTRKADLGVAAFEREASGLAGSAALDATARERINRAMARLADELVDGD